MARIDGDFTTITVRSSWPAATADGSTALVFDTVESGTIAFAVDQKAVQAIRNALNDIENLLFQKPGNS